MAAKWRESSVAAGMLPKRNAPRVAYQAGAARRRAYNAGMKWRVIKSAA